MVRTDRYSSAKEIAFLSLFLAIVIGAQYVFMAIPGVEIVTVLFVAYSYAMGKSRGMVAATAFSLLRQIVFGVFINVLILYVIYYNLLAFIFGMIGNIERKKGFKRLWVITLCACVCCAFFTCLDNVLTPIWYGFTWEATKTYFIASLPFALPQIVCVFFTVGYLFWPLEKVFSLARKNLKN